MPLDKSLSSVGGLLQTYTRHVLIVPEGTPGELESNLKKILLPTGQEKLYSVLAIACCLFSYNDKDTSSTPMCPVLAVFTSALTTAVSLYYSVYADAKTQRQSIWLLHGISVVTCALREKSKALILRSTNLSQLLLPLLSQCATTLDFLLASVLRILRNFENGKKEDFGSMLGTSLQDMDATSVAIGGLSLLPTLDRSTRTSLLTSLLSFLSQHLQPRLIDNATTSADAILPTRLLSLLIPNVHRLILLQQEEGGALSPSDSDVISATFFALFDCTKNLTPSNFRIIMSDESSNKLSRLLKDSGYHHFGHCNSMLLSCRWHAASACLDTHVSSFPSLSSTLGVLHERFLAQLANHIETSPTAALPPLMSIAKKAIRWKLALHPANLDTTLKEVSFLLEAAWLAVLSDEYVPLVGINSYISLSLDASLVSSTPASFVLLYFDRIFGYGCMNRPHVVQSLLCHLCLTLFQEDPSLCLPFLPRIRDMLLYKEPKGDDNSVPDYEDTMGEVGLVCRLLLLQFFESIELPSPTFLPNKESVFRSGMEALIRDLILMNTQGPFVKASMIGTEIFGTYASFHFASFYCEFKTLVNYRSEDTFLAKPLCTISICIPGNGNVFAPRFVYVSTASLCSWHTRVHGNICRRSRYYLHLCFSSSTFATLERV